MAMRGIGLEVADQAPAAEEQEHSKEKPHSEPVIDGNKVTKKAPDVAVAEPEAKKTKVAKTAKPKQMEATQEATSNSKPEPIQEKRKSKRAVGRSKSHETTVNNSEVETDEMNRLRVKQNIKKIIQKYKRKKITEEDVAKRGNEPIQVYEEISKIEQQIIDIIESNPNIINKEYVKSRLSETIKQELIHAMDPNAVGMLRHDQLKFKPDADKGEFYY